jgi:hypothetical protein
MTPVSLIRNEVTCFTGRLHAFAVVVWVRRRAEGDAVAARLILIALTALSSALGTDHGLGNRASIALVIIVVAVFKVRSGGSVLHGIAGRAGVPAMHI